MPGLLAPKGRDMQCTVRTVVAVLVLLSAVSAGASVLGIAPRPPRIWHPAENLPRDEVFARIDALAARLHAQGFRTDHEDFEFAVLNLCTGRSEDRSIALDILEGLAQRAPDRLDVLLWTMRAHHRARDGAGAIAALEAARDHFEEQAAYHYALGFAHWFDAQRHLKPESVGVAIHHLKRATELAPGSADHSAALASVCLVADRPDAALDHLPPVEEGRAVALPLLLLRAGLLSYEASTQELSENLFGQALAAMPDELASVFEHGGGWLPGVLDGDVATVARYWDRVDPDPVRRSNGHRLEFWRRLLQADALWGDAESGTPGWDTETGDAWVRWGRPTVTSEITPDIGAIVAVRDDFRPPSANRRYTRRNYRTWVWTWVRGPSTFSLNFVDQNYLRDWAVAPESRPRVEALRRDKPLQFSRGGRSSPFDLALEMAVLASTRERASAILSMAVVASDESTDRRVEDLGDVELQWALFDNAENRLDQGTILADPSRDRESLLAAFDPERRAHGLRPARTARVGLDVEPGRYRLALEGEDRLTGARRWIDLRFAVRGRPDDASPTMSALMLGASFDDYAGDTDVPTEFVRYATVVLPLPERVIPRAQDQLFVYFEVYDLGLAADGRTRFSITYRVTPIGRADGTPSIDEFVEERTGVSPDGVVVKGTGLDLRELESGAHELVVTVVDQVRDVTLERSLEFVIEEPSGPEEGR